MNSVHKGNRKVNESNIHTKKKLYSVHVAFWFFSFTSKTTPWQKRRSKADAINVRSFSLHLTQNGRAVLITVILGARNRFLLYRIWCASLYNFQHLFFFLFLSFWFLHYLYGVSEYRWLHFVRRWSGVEKKPIFGTL